MRNVLMLAAAALSLAACATPEALERQAALDCQAVGISQNDPQYGTCTEAYRRQFLENRLTQSYRDASSASPEDRRIRHQWHGF